MRPSPGNVLSRYSLFRSLPAGRRLLLLGILYAPAAGAEPYAELGLSLAQIKTATGSTLPVLADLRLGYALDAHKLELALMPGIRDDNLNRLVTEVPLAGSLLYRFTVPSTYSIRIDLVLGYSQVEISSSYVDVPGFSETYRGVSYGIGFEESLSGIPQLKFKLDFMQLYRGDRLKINAFNLGFRYVF